MHQQQSYGLPPPVVSGLQSPFISSFPIELQNISPPNAKPSIDDATSRRKSWKHEGYGVFSKWMASDDDLFVFRRFQSLNARTILYMQDRIGQIETRLAQLHDENAHGDEKRKNNSFRWDMHHEPERDRLMCELTGLLNHYNQYVHVFSKIRARPKAEERQVNNLHEFRGRNSIKAEEMKFIDHEHDLISINHHPSTPLGKILTAMKFVRLSSLMRAKPVDGAHSSSTHYASDEALGHLSTGSVIFLGFVMLLCPIWWLEYVNDSKTRLGIITGFLAFFMSLMSLATVNRPFEVVASSAAYAAVLMVFMQVDVKR